MATEKVTAYNKSASTVEAAGAFWPGRKTSTHSVQAHRVDEVDAHPQLEVEKKAETKKAEKKADKES